MERVLQRGAQGTNTLHGTLTFQVRPSLDECINLLLPTAHSGGMLVGLGNASVRTVSGSIRLLTWRIACNDPPLSVQVLSPDW